MHYVLNRLSHNIQFSFLTYFTINHKMSNMYVNLNQICPIYSSHILKIFDVFVLYLLHNWFGLCGQIYVIIETFVQSTEHYMHEACVCAHPQRSKKTECDDKQVEGNEDPIRSLRNKKRLTVYIGMKWVTHVMK